MPIWSSKSVPPPPDPTKTEEQRKLWEATIADLADKERRRAHPNYSLHKSLEAELTALRQSDNQISQIWSRATKGKEKFHQRQRDLCELETAYDAITRLLRYTMMVPISPAYTDADLTINHDIMQTIESARTALGSNKLVDPDIAMAISRLDQYRSEAERARLVSIATEAHKRAWGDATICLKKAQTYTQVGMKGKCDC